MTRRDFLLKGMQFALGGAILALFGALLSRGQITTAPAGLNCANDRICRGCPSMEGCRLPEGLSFKRIRNDLSLRRRG